jgi:hypothetical protein
MDGLGLNPQRNQFELIHKRKGNVGDSRRPPEISSRLKFPNNARDGDDRVVHLATLSSCIISGIPQVERLLTYERQLEYQALQVVPDLLGFRRQSSRSHDPELDSRKYQLPKQLRRLWVESLGNQVEPISEVKKEIRGESTRSQRRRVG